MDIKLIRYLKNLSENSSLFGHLLDLVADFPAYRSYIYHKIDKTQKDLALKRNFNVIIETTNLCNAHCLMCPQSIMKRPRQIMSDQVFKKIIQAIKTDKISPTAIILNGFGDPLTDNKIIYRINRLKTSFPSSAIKIYTNLSLASQSTLKNLIKSGLDEINISLNGIDRQSYQKIMGLDYSRVVNNLRQLIKVRNKSRSDLIIRLSYALIEKNEKNYSKFVKRWKKAVDSVSTNKVHSYSQTFLPQGKIHTIDFNRKPFPCKNIFNTVVFTVTGDISLCCLDYEASHTFGNIQEKRPLEIFNSIKFNQYRQAHLSSNLSKLPICNKCYAPYKGGIEWLFDKLY